LGQGGGDWAKPVPAWNVTTAAVSGTIKRRMIKAVPPATSKVPNVFPIEERSQTGLLRFLKIVNNPWNLATARRRTAPDGDICVF
jgi:hypothetical protein